MKFFSLFIFLSLITVSFGYTKLEKFSTADALEVLNLVETIENGNPEDRAQYITKFEKLTDHAYDPSIRSKLYEIIGGNTQRTSIYAKIVGLFSFQTVILVSMVLVCIALIFSLLSDLIIMLGAYIGTFIYKLFFTKQALYTHGIIISCITIYFKPDEIENWLLRYLFIFDWVTPMFGCLIFNIVAQFINSDINKDSHKNSKDKPNTDVVDTLVTFVWTIAAMHHQNWLIGVMSIMMIFNIFGFRCGSFIFGYYVRFEDDNLILRCIVISLLLNAIMVMTKIGFIMGNIVKYLLVFETGVYFWTTLVGFIGMLVYSDEYYMITHLQYTRQRFFIMQIVMASYCIAHMYLGNILYIEPYRTIGGTFLFFLGLDLQRVFFDKFKSSLTLCLFIVLANLYALKQLINWYPEYFIF